MTALEWSHERLANTLRIAAEKTGADRDGWLEDASYWQEIVSAIARSWQPIDTAPKDRAILLFAVTDVAEDGTALNWKTAVGSYKETHDSELSQRYGYSPWVWEGRPVYSYQAQPTHWMPLPEPPL